MAEPNSEFVIWGRLPGATHETLLISEYQGLVDREHAERQVAHMAANGCTDMRIQHLEPLGDGSELAGMFRQAAKP